ncbi:MAG: tetratricopeptide repeat protein [Phycisphaerae bacterium]|nr:tetratricopeptide repeat protein [Phycisphaerae bacterium]
MPRKRLFVGRKTELAQWAKVLALPEGQAVVVVGQQGMGKTMLVNKMAQAARERPDLSCGTVRYEITPTDGAAATMALMLDHAFEAARMVEGSFDATERRLAQWRAFLNVLKVGDLVLSLRRDPQRDTRDQFLERLDKVSNRMPPEGRAVFVIDPEKYMQQDSDQAWAIVVRRLPPKIKLIFAQRQDDCIITGEAFRSLTNVVRIPSDGLDVLDEQAVDDLLHVRARQTGRPADVLRKALAPYRGHPFAIPAALDLIEDGQPLDQLPTDPTYGIAEAQWKRVCEHSTEAMSLFKTYAILEVAVPDDVVQAVSGLDANTREHLLADRYLGGLVHRQGESRRIYHSLLGDHVAARPSGDEAREYHRRAMDAYRRRLKTDAKPDALAAQRLAGHVREAEGQSAFVKAFADECTRPLLTLGLLDTALSLSREALAGVARESVEEAVLSGNLGNVLCTRGDLDDAEAMYDKSLAIHEKLGRLEGMASNYGNIGNVLYTRGDLDGAEAMYRKALEIDEKLGRLEYMANQYGNIGNVLQTRGDLAGAEAMYRKALEIDEKLGRLEGMASDYGNLGNVLQTRGDLAGAEAMHNKALEIDEKLGRLEGMASEYGNLGNVLARRGDLDGAEVMYRKSLEIDEKLGRLEGMANQYANLGLVLRTRGDLDGARGLWIKARDLYKQMGIPHMVEQVQGRLDQLDRGTAGDRPAPPR